MQSVNLGEIKVEVASLIAQTDAIHDTLIQRILGRVRIGTRVKVPKPPPEGGRS